MQITWNVDERNVVVFTRRRFSTRVAITLNGQEVYGASHFRFRATIPLTLVDGRPARVVLSTESLSVARVELFVGDELMVPTDAFATTKCEKCGAAVNPNDRFCDGCGHALPSAGEIQRRRRVAEATKTIATLGVLFAVFGLFLFLVQRSTSADALNNLSGLDPSAVIPVEGKSYTVAELRAQVTWEPWSVLAVNLVLAAVMGALFLWGKKKPLPAMLAAGATYAVVIVGSAVADPKTIAQGIFVKIIVISILTKGIRAALEMRTA